MNGSKSISIPFQQKNMFHLKTLIETLYKPQTGIIEFMPESIRSRIGEL